MIRYHVSAKYDFGDKAMLVMNGGRLDGQMLKNIGVVIVSAEAANMRLGVLCVAGVWVGLFGRAHFSWSNGHDLYRNHRHSDNFDGVASLQCFVCGKDKTCVVVAPPRH